VAAFHRVERRLLPAPGGVRALASPARFASRLLPTPLYACAGTSFLVAGAGVAAWNSVQPFERALLVPLGVSTDVRLPVVLGSFALMAALGGIRFDLGRVGAPPAQPSGRHRAWFVSLLSFLAISVLVGTGLAWNLPWT
jgi:hypothetical protein